MPQGISPSDLPRPGAPLLPAGALFLPAFGTLLVTALALAPLGQVVSLLGLAVVVAAWARVMAPVPALAVAVTGSFVFDGFVVNALGDLLFGDTWLVAATVLSAVALVASAWGRRRRQLRAARTPVADAAEQYLRTGRFDASR